MISWASQDPKKPNCDPPCSCQICIPPPISPAGKVLHLASPLWARWTILQLFINLTFPACGIKQINHILPQDTSSSCYYRICFHSAVHAVLKCKPYVALPSMQCHSPLDCEYMWLTVCCQVHLTSVGYYVFGYLVLFSVGYSFISGMTRRWSEYICDENE